MAQSSHKFIRQSLGALVDKGRRKVFGKSIQSLPGLQSTANVNVGSPLQKKFKKSNDVRHDISVLAMSYILEDNPTIKDLIRLVIGLTHSNDPDGKISEIVAVSARFTLQLVSFHEEDSLKALTAITDFLTTMREIDSMARGGTETTDNMNDRMNESITQIKSKNPALGHPDRNINDEKGLGNILTTIISATSTILDIFKEASALIPVPYVKPVVTIVASLLTAVQQTRSNLDDMKYVATVAGEFVVTLAVACAGEEVKPSRPFQHALDGLQNKLHVIAQKCNELSHRNVLWQFLQQGVDQNSLSAMKEDLHNAVQQFQTEAQLLQHLDLRFLGQVTQVINGKLDEDAVNALPKALSYVGRRDEYRPGSRSDAIQIIADWVENSNLLAFWMCGAAGLGKSTLAHELVDCLRARGRLATFAFLVGGSSSDPATVIRTMAKELCALHPRSIPQVAEAARTCNSSHLLVRDYLKSYIINPIRSLSSPYPLVIVVDGLDEWAHHEVFLEELEYMLAESSHVKILLISRPYYSIERSLLKVAPHKYELPPVSQAVTEAYFTHHFEKIDWKMRNPSSITISELARLADGLLIWAAMVCSLLSNKSRPGLPHERLEHIISSGRQIALGSQLSNLYLDALKQLFQQEDQELFQRVFGAMTVLQESLPLRDFARLLGLYDDQVIEVQSRLTAFQTRGTYDKNIVPPASHRFHISFVELTMNRTAEVGDPLIPYLIDPRLAHQSVAEGCLNFLNHFLSSFRGSQCSHSDLRNLESYAVEFWPSHVANSNDRSTPLAPKLECLLLELPENHLRRWAAWFLAMSVPASSEDWDQVVGGIDTDGFYFSLAKFLENVDPTLISRRTFILEVAVRLQPEVTESWRDLGDSYREHFESTYTLDLLNNAIIVYRHAMEMFPKDGSHATPMSVLAYALWLRFSRTGLITDVEEAISRNRESLSLLPTPHPLRFVSLGNLSLGLWSRFKRTGLMADLEEAILMNRELLSLCPAPHAGRSSSLNHLATALRDRFKRTGLMADLEEAILMHRESLCLRPAPHPDRSRSLNNLANGLWDHFTRTGLMAYLEEAILMHRESLCLRPAPHPDRSQSLNNLANALRNRFKRTGLMADLEEAILMHRESLSLCPAPHPNRSSSLFNLAVALGDHSRRTGLMADLEEAILMNRESLFLRPAPHPERSSSLNNLATALGDRSRRTGLMADLEEAILMNRESLFLCPAPHPERSSSLNHLATALRDRFTRTGLMADLEEAILMHRESLSLCPAPHPDRSQSLNNLANGLWDHFTRTGLMAYLEEAILMHRESLCLRPAPHPDRSQSLNNLANALRDRFKRRGLMADLEEAILMHRESLSLCPAPHPDRYASLNNLANALRDHFTRTGLMADLEEAILMHRESLSLCPAPHPDRYASLNNLANALRDHFTRTGLMADLEEAILMHRESLSLCPAPHPNRSFSLFNLAVALGDRSRRTGLMADLEEAILMHRESLSLRPAPHPDRSSSLFSLAAALGDGFTRTGLMADLEEAILMHRESLCLRPAPHPDRSWSLYYLAAALDKTGSIIGLDEVIIIYRELLSLHPVPHPDRLQVAYSLASALETRFKQNGQQSDLDEVTSLRQEARRENS